MRTAAPIPEDAARTRPGLLELIVGLAVYLICLMLIVLWVVQIPDERAAFRGIAANAANGLAGLAGFLAAWALRIRDFGAFGFRKTEPKWLWISLGLGLFAFALSFLVEAVYFSFIDEPNTQADFQVAAKAGLLSLAALVATGGLFTPIGEELVFRGVVANALNRYGAFAGIFLSAAIFGLVHGLSVILLLAFMVGVMAGWLFWRTQSLWPCILLHVVYNSLHLLYYSTL